MWRTLIKQIFLIGTLLFFNNNIYFFFFFYGTTSKSPVLASVIFRRRSSQSTATLHQLPIPNLLASSVIWSSHVFLGRPLSLFPIHLPCTVFFEFLRSFILITYTARLNLLSLTNSDTGGSLYSPCSSWLN